MAVKKRTLAAIIAILIVLAMIISLLVFNYITYSRCTDSDSETSPGCHLSAGENQTADDTGSNVRFDFGENYLGTG